jgi:serine/threonine-protein kinase
LNDTEPTFGDGRYVVRRELGRGTMGVVYEAEDPVLARTVAVKTIDLAFAAGEKARADFERRFFTEARVAAQLSHPGIVICHDVGKDAASGRLFIVFEHLKGRTLEERAAQGAMPWRDALEIVIQVARAIHHAHEHGVVHRDLKPANIMLLDGGARGSAPTAKIMDFGVARLESLGPRITRTGQAFGSPLYLSPEQALGQPSTQRSDIFSLGSVLCTLLLGRPWFQAPSLPKIVDRVAHDDAPRPSKLRSGLPPALDDVVAKALEKSEADRYATAAAMADDLEDVLSGRPARHAAGTASASSSRGRSSDDDTLLAGLTGARSASRGLPTHDPLASLLDDGPAPEPVSKAAAIPPAPAAATLPIGAVGTAVTARAPRRWLVPAASAALGIAVVAGVLFSARRSPAPAPIAPPSATVAASAPSTLVATEPIPPPSTTLLPINEPTVTLAPEILPDPTRIPAARPTVAFVRPTALPVAPVTEPPAITMPAVEEPVATPPAPAGTRIRLTVTHPFEDGRLIVWVDGVLVHEAKLQAELNKRIVAFKVREGRAEKMLDVEPGKHEVRVEVTWKEGRTTRTKVVDVASGSTGLLEAKVGRVSKDLSLNWSRLVKD